MKRVAKVKNIDLNIYHAKEHTSNLGLKQNSLTFAFYQDGEIKKKLDFIDLSEDDNQIVSQSVFSGSIGCISWI
ncbi:hypothetical protein V2I71_01915 [Peribacillus frigoritolerans]|uniref:hypothetical protein n=1 Tax=Peribacillus frigoritolerans TaxID=450367 RepID=UPI002ED22A98|nr:hypothetical protein V2I71_01915 [Peribacillus frigoritolerans]